MSDAGPPAEPIASRDVVDAIGLPARAHVAFVGGGGKSTLLRAMAIELANRHRPVVATTTTKMAAKQSAGFVQLLGPTTAEVVVAARTPMATAPPPMVWASVDNGKAVGVDPVCCDEWFAAGLDVIVEADGARRRPFKAHGPFEPVIPSSATTVVNVIGADALGRVIADQCHRPMRVAALADCSPYVRLSPEAAARVITHERGVRAAVPENARFVVVVTKVADDNRKFVTALVDALGDVETVAVAFEHG